MDTVVFTLRLSQFQLGTSPGQPPGISLEKLPGGQDLTFESCLGAENSRRAGILCKMEVKLQKIAWIKFKLILASTPNKSLRRFGKDNNHLEKFDTY